MTRRARVSEVGEPGEGASGDSPTGLCSGTGHTEARAMATRVTVVLGGVAEPLVFESANAFEQDGHLVVATERGIRVGRFAIRDVKHWYVTADPGV